MPLVVHVVATGRFAGVERYVCDVATATAGRGWDVAVVGGDRTGMRATLADDVRWEPGARGVEAIRSVSRIGRADISHAHMTAAEAVAVATRRIHRAPIVSTRHFAARRGATVLGRTVAPWISRHLALEIANGSFIAGGLERPPAAVIPPGVSDPGCLWRASSRGVLVLQRLEPEKDTLTALRAWKASCLASDGWSMRVVGDGALRRDLERHVERESIEGVEFTGWTCNVLAQFRWAGMLLASAVAEPFGLSVLEAMSAGVPVVASAAGGHMETVGKVEGAQMFQPRDVSAAAAAMRALLADSVRERLSMTGRRLVAERFALARHVDQLIGEYDAARAGGGRHDRTFASAAAT